MIVTFGSLNPEFTGTFDTRGGAEKLALIESSLTIAGTSACVAKAANLIGSQTLTIGFVGPQGSLESQMLGWAIMQSGLNFKLIEALDHTSFAFLPIDIASKRNRLAGKRGLVVESMVQSVSSQVGDIVASCPDAFGVATGLRCSEIPFAKAIYKSTVRGKRVLSPNRELCAKLDESLLGEVDCLVLNELEFESTSQTIGSLRDLGPRVVIVTKGRKGGEVLLNGFSSGSYEPFVMTERESPGTGDWFLGALLAYFDKFSLSFDTVQTDELGEALKFAATVAGYKAQFYGSAKGPESEFLQKLIRQS